MELNKIHIKSESGYYTFYINDCLFMHTEKRYNDVFYGYVFTIKSSNNNMLNLFRRPQSIEFILESDSFYYKNEHSLISGEIKPYIQDGYVNQITWHSNRYPYRVEKSKQILSELIN